MGPWWCGSWWPSRTFRSVSLALALFWWDIGGSEKEIPEGLWGQSRACGLQGLWFPGGCGPWAQKSASMVGARLWRGSECGGPARPFDPLEAALSLL